MENMFYFVETLHKIGEVSNFLCINWTSQCFSCSVQLHTALMTVTSLIPVFLNYILNFTQPTLVFRKPSTLLSDGRRWSSRICCSGEFTSVQISRLSVCLNVLLLSFNRGTKTVENIRKMFRCAAELWCFTDWDGKMWLVEGVISTLEMFNLQRKTNLLVPFHA